MHSVPVQHFFGEMQPVHWVELLHTPAPHGEVVQVGLLAVALHCSQESPAAPQFIPPAGVLQTGFPLALVLQHPSQLENTSQ